MYDVAVLTVTNLQVWWETERHELVLAQLLCLDASTAGDGGPRLAKCHEMGGSQEWQHHHEVNYTTQKMRNFTLIVHGDGGRDEPTHDYFALFWVPQCGRGVRGNPPQNQLIQLLNKWRPLFYCLCLLQLQTPIYNMAAGTCLGAQNNSMGARVTMELCTKPHGTKWDLVHTKRTQ